MKPTTKNKKNSISTQTPAVVEPPSFFEFSEKDDIKTSYTKALQFVNQCHIFFNTALEEDVLQFKGNGTKFEEDDTVFRFPEIPNYFSVYTLMGKKNIGKKSWEILDNKCFSSEAFLSIDKVPDFMFLKENLNSFSNSTMVIDNKKLDKEPPLPVTPSEKSVKNCAVNVQTGDLFDDQTKKVIEDIIHKNVEASLHSLLNTNLDTKRVKLAKSNLQVASMQPEVNILDYKKRKSDIKQNFDSYKKQAKSEMVFLNQPSPIRPSTPKLVNEMFKKISKENIRAETLAQTLGGCHSDDDSVIFDDDEYEKLKSEAKCGKVKKVEDYVKSKTDFLYINGKKNDKNFRKNHKSSGDQLPTKSHPLQLTGKNKSKADERALNVIGLFTERGDIRPGVIDIIEQKKNSVSNNRKNVEFRKTRELHRDHQTNQYKNRVDYFERAISISSRVSSNESVVSAVCSDMKTDSEYEFVQIQQSQFKLRNKRF